MKVGLLGGATFLDASGALAQQSRSEQPELPLELEWNAPPGCASGTQVRAEMERIVRARPGFSLPRLSVHAEVRGTHSEYRVRLELTRAGETTRREFESEDCKALVRAATLSIALAFGDGADIAETNEPAGPANPEPFPSSPAPSAMRPAPRELPVPRTAKTANRSLELGAGGAWSPHWLGGNAFGAQASAAMHWPRATLTWTNRVWLPHTLHPTATASSRFWAATTSFAPGVQHRFGAVEFELGLVLQLGVIGGVGADIDSPAQAWAPWYAVAPSARLSLELGRGVRVVLGQEFVLTPVRPEFEIAPIGTVYRVPLLTPVTTLSCSFDAVRF